jgi:putative DNA primase/helicase
MTDLNGLMIEVDEPTPTKVNGKAHAPAGEAKSAPEPLSDADFDAEISRLAKLSLKQRERQRNTAAARLQISPSRLDRLVNAERGESSGDGKQGRAVELPEPEPWSDPVNGAALLNDLSAALRLHVVMNGHEAETAALWVVHTYMLDNFGISPRLAITSPEKQCGKTTLLDVLACLVWRRLPTANVTAAAIFRVVEKARPTLLIDEADTFLPDNEELRGILNAGHRRGGSVTRTVGDDHEPRQFSTYAACAIALIGNLPSTLTDRSVSIELRRRRQDEPVEPFRFEKTGHLDRLARQAARWAADNAERVRGADPEMPDGIYNRTADN